MFLVIVGRYDDFEGVSVEIEPWPNEDAATTYARQIVEDEGYEGDEDTALRINVVDCSGSRLRFIDFSDR